MKALITHFPRSTYKVMPWKNGAGSTTELCISPREASVQSGFDWRISLAHVPASGPFSSFPGYHRTIMLLQGEPMQLVHEGHGTHTLQVFQPYAFQGSWITEGILSGGPVQDFNVMMREGVGQVHVDVHQVRDKTPFPIRSVPVQFIWCWSGAARVDVQTSRHSLQEQESLLIEEGANITIHPESADCVLIIVSMTPHSG